MAEIMKWKAFPVIQTLCISQNGFQQDLRPEACAQLSATLHTERKAEN